MFIPNITNFNSLLILGVTLSLISLTGGLTSSGLRPGEKKRLLGISALGIAICLGLLGEYIGRIFNEVKPRPVYVVEEVVGRDPQIAAHPSEKAWPATAVASRR